MQKIRLFLVLLLLMSTWVLHAEEKGLVMRSPKGIVKAEIMLCGNTLRYSVKGNGKIIIHPSLMGLKVNGVEYGSEVSELKIAKEWDMVDTLHHVITSYHAYLWSVKEKGKEYAIEFRLSDEGCAFRYLFEGEAPYEVERELTTFVLPSMPVWFFERDNDWKLKTYAGLWKRTLTDSLHLISKQGPIQGKPLVFELAGGGFALLTEAALYDYSGLRFKASAGRILQADFTEENGFQVEAKELNTPWRVLVFAENLNRLVNNTMIKDLNPLPERKLFADIAYIKPGRSVWSWITREDKYLDIKEEMHFIEAAATLKFEYTLIDEGWETKWPDKWPELERLCRYAAKRKVGVWVWKHSKELRDPLQRNNFLDSIKNAGVVGVKTDFMDSEAKELIDFETGFLRAAAERKLMVNFHGCQAPTGESKTFPNEMTREGIRGMELNVMGEPIPAGHNAALPFTRLVLGPSDYTPGLFFNRGNTTYTHQLALLYLFDSPLQCLAENPVKLLADNRFKPIIPLLQELPVLWDETLVLEGSVIGELAAFARRKGNDWYVVAINGTDKDKELRLTPTFLKYVEKHKATLITDAVGKEGFTAATFIIKQGDTKKIILRPNSGMVMHIK